VAGFIGPHPAQIPFFTIILSPQSNAWPMIRTAPGPHFVCIAKASILDRKLVMEVV
jgi:hypothetical protein